MRSHRWGWRKWVRPGPAAGMLAVLAVLSLATPMASEPAASDSGELGTLSGRFHPKAPSVPLPERVLLRPLRPLIPPSGPPAPTESFECPVDEAGSWSCSLPVATYDLAIGAPGFVPQLRQGVEVRSGETLALGTFLVEPSQSISGWITQEAGVLEPERCLLRVLRSAEDRGSSRIYAIDRGDQRGQRDPRLLERRLSRDGSFTITPVEAGTRALEVYCPGFVLLHVDGVRIVPGKTTRLRKILLLRRPLEIAVEVRPPLDAEGERWTVLLDRLSLGPSFLRRPVGRHMGKADLTGRYLVPRLAPGRARLQVLDGKGVRRARRDVRIDSPADSPLRVDLGTIHVEGVVLYRNGTVPAQLAFRDEVSGYPIPMRTDRRGEFEGELPRAGRWRVDVRASRLRRAPIPVRVLVEADDAGRAELEVRIPEMRVRGRVLDPNGEPAEKATVALFGIDDERATVTDERGRFELRFVAAGPWALAARRGAGDDWKAAVSPLIEVAVKEGRDAGPIDLPLTELRRVGGLVTAAGEPVARAEVQARVEGGFPLRTASRKDGSFQLDLPEDLLSEVLLVRPRRGALRSFEVRLREGPIVLDLTDEKVEGAGESGVVAIELRESWGALRGRGTRLDLFQDGRLIPFHGLEQWSLLRGHVLSPAATSFSLPRLAPGSYRVCLGPEGPLERIDPAAYRAGKVECDEARLQPGEELRLRPVI